MANLRGYSEEFWRKVFYEDNLSYKEISKIIGCSESSVYSTIKTLGWGKRKAKDKKNFVITDDDIKRLSDFFSLDEEIIKSDISGSNLEMRNADMIIFREKKHAIEKVKSYYNSCECETCCVNWDYCRKKFRNEYNCKRIIDAWLEEPAEDYRDLSKIHKDMKV